MNGEETVQIRQAITNHLAGFWPNSVVTHEHWDRGPIQENLPGFEILKFVSRTPNRPVIYATNGCFVGIPEDHIKPEFFIIAPQENIQHVETLSMLANFHTDESFHLKPGAVVKIGRKWIEDSACDHFLISIPYPYGPKLEWLNTQGVCIRFLWALPITAREAAFVDLHDAEKLERKFEEVRLDYLNPSRSSVV